MKFKYQKGSQQDPQILVQDDAGNVLLSIVDNQTLLVIQRTEGMNPKAIAKAALEAGRWNRRQIAEENNAS